MEALILAAVFAFGVLLIYDALVRPDTRPDPKKLAARIGPRGSGAMGGAAVAFALTGWFAASLAGAVLGAILPRMIASSRKERDTVRRMDAIAELAGRLRDSIRSGIGAYDALAHASVNPPAAIASDVKRLAAEMRVSGMARAAEAFAGRVGKDAELLGAALSLGDRLGSRNTSEVLDALAEATAARAATLREARARQTRARSSARIVAAVPLLLLLAIRRTNPAYLAPFDAAQGQMVLMFAFALIGVGYVSMLRMARLEGRSK